MIFRTGPSLKPSNATPTGSLAADPTYSTGVIKEGIAQKTK
jgi:hypothetical protein